MATTMAAASDRPKLEIACPYCARRASHRADTLEEVAEGLLRFLNGHVQELHADQIAMERPS